MATLSVPSFVPSPSEDAEELRKAFAGWGTNEGLIISILAHRNAAQRKQIRQAYADVFGEDLLKALDKELTRDFERVVLLWTLEPAERDALLAFESSKKWGPADRALIEIACTRSTDDLLLVRKAYQARYKRSLEEDVAAHTKGDFRKLLVPLVSSLRYEGAEVNLSLGKSEAKILHEKIADKAYSDEEIIRILTTRSKAQLFATFNEYNNEFGNPISKQKFKLDDGEHKAYTLQMVGKLWRAYKSRLRRKLSKCKRKDLKKFKPSGSEQVEWDIFQKRRLSKDFTEKSIKFKAMKLKQDIPYTGSRKGYARIEEDMRKESADPSSITRVDVWCRGHTKKSGEASSQVVANCLEKIQEFKASHPPNVSLRSYEDDALAHVLGPERRGRFRGIGSGVNASKLKFRAQSNAKVAQLEQKVETMMEQIERLGHIIIDQKSFIDKFINQDQQSREYEKMTQQKTLTPESNESVRNDQVVQKNTFGSQCQGIARNNQKVQNNLYPIEAQQDKIHKWKEGGKCLLYNWMNPTEIVAKGRWTSNDPDMLVHFKRLGNNASKVWIDKSLNGSALLWRQNSEMKTIKDAIDTPIAWPTDYIIMMNENDDFMEDGDIDEDEGFEY